MVSSTSQQPRVAETISSGLKNAPSNRRTPPREGSLVTRITVGMIVVAILAGAAWGAVQLMQNQGDDKASSTLTAKVKRDELLVTVIEDGNLESAVNIDIKCEVAGGTSILWIVDDGTEVTKGEKIVELDAAALEESINQQRIAFEKARAAKIQAEKNYAAAKLAVEEYLQGTFVQAVQDQDAADHDRRGELAVGAKRVGAFGADVPQRLYQRLGLGEPEVLGPAGSTGTRFGPHGQGRAGQVHQGENGAGTGKCPRFGRSSDAQSEGASFDLEESRLKRLEAQMEKCVITAPASGMVVYANDQGGRFGGSQQPQIEEGAMVRERQTILRLPDLSQMQVKVNVHESKIEMLGRAMEGKSGRGQGPASSHSDPGTGVAGESDEHREPARTVGMVDGKHQGICHHHLD